MSRTSATNVTLALQSFVSRKLRCHADAVTRRGQPIVTLWPENRYRLRNCIREIMHLDLLIFFASLRSSFQRNSLLACLREKFVHWRVDFPAFCSTFKEARRSILSPILVTRRWCSRFSILARVTDPLDRRFLISRLSRICFR